MPIILGDILTSNELTQVAFWLHEQDEDGAIREQFRLSGMGINPAEKLSAQSDAAKIQLIWTASTAELVNALDSLIRTGGITVEAGDVRRPRLNLATSGAFRIEGALGPLGVRFSPHASGLPVLRLQRLVESLYDFGNPDDEAEIRWQLRAVEGLTLQARLAEFLRVTDPATAVHSLVLSRRRNVDKAIDELKMSPDDLKDPRDLTGDRDASDDLVVERILWKLGFDQKNQFKVTSDFWRHHQEMMRLTRDAGTNQTSSIENLRNAGTSFFVELEHVLDDSLMFSWWALTVDHPSSLQPFVYTQSQGEKAWESLDVFWKGQNEKDRVNLRDRRTLWQLSQSFKILAAYLRELQANSADRLRDVDKFPEFNGKTVLQRFPFEHTHLFLDLLPDSQDLVLRGLESVHEALQRADVHSVRNELAHFQRSALELQRLEAALDGARRAVEKLESLGMCRMTYTPIKSNGDEWGRSRHVFRGPDGNDVAFSRPSPFGWSGMPDLRTPQYIMTCATFAPSNEVLRFLQGSDSDFAKMWADYPKRRQASENVLAEPTETPEEVHRLSHGVLPTQR